MAANELVGKQRDVCLPGQGCRGYYHAPSLVMRGSDLNALELDVVGAAKEISLYARE